jgi:ABC-type Fe3+-hydroxamate transport system substrate-binding protein
MVVEIIDQIGGMVRLNSVPQRLVCLVPSITELIFELGMGHTLVGITKFCELPKEQVQTIQKIGGTKNIHVATILSLQPDLVIANKEENRKEDIEALKRFLPVYVSEVKDLEDNNALILQLADLLGVAEKGIEIVENIRACFLRLEQVVKPHQMPSVAYIIWRKPYMAAGNDTFINDMLNRCGWSNYYAIPRYPEIDINLWKMEPPDLVLLSSEPYPFTRQHISEIRQINHNLKIKLVDGQMFSWYGARMLHAPEYFIKFLETI